MQRRTPRIVAQGCVVLLVLVITAFTAARKWATVRIHDAARLGHERQLRWQIWLEPDSVHDQNEAGQTPLVLAAKYGHAAAVRRLLEAGADPWHRDHRQLSALHWSIWRGSIEVVRLLLEARPSAECIGDPMLLTLAAGRGWVEITRMLLAAGADVNGRAGRYESTPLHVAIRRGEAETVQLLLQHGADVTLADGVGRTAVQLALWRDDPAIASQVLSCWAPLASEAETARKLRSVAQRTSNR